MKLETAALPRVSAGRPHPAARTALRLEPYLPWFLGSFLLGTFLAHSPLLATAHAAGVLLVGLRAAWDAERPERVAAVIVYIAGVEVLWRMTDADVFHQYGKYLASGLMLVWLLRAGAFRRVLGPVLYFLCLVPSTWITIEDQDLAFIKGRLSFNLSGPLVLFLALLFFRQIRITRRQLVRVLAAGAAGVVSVYAVALVSTLGAQHINFTTESNYVTSGGFGPNQVSATLGLGTVLLFWMLLLTDEESPARLAIWGLILLLGTQSALTFSRGGIYTAVGAVAVSLPFLARDSRVVRHMVGMGIVLLLLAQFAIVPVLHQFTGGKIEERFQQTQLTGRELIMRRDLALWEQNPLLGVGPGRSMLTSVEYDRQAIAHTEFTRLAAEHGMLGICAVLILIVMVVGAGLRAEPGLHRAFALSCSTWGLLFMSHAAMRLSAPGILLGLGAVELIRSRRR